MPLIPFEGKEPEIHSSAYVSPRAIVIGDVAIGEGSSVWENAVIRGDMTSIRIGRFTSIQDNCTVHIDTGHPVKIGDHVTVGHNAVIHGCSIGDYVLVGIGAIVLSGAEIEGPSIIGAGAVVREDTKIPSHSLSVGVPASIIRRLRKQDIEKMKRKGEEYLQLSQHHKAAKNTHPKQTI